MNVLTAFVIECVLTLSIGLLLVAYMRPSLYSVLVDLCGTEGRARFWLAFSSVLLVGVPAASSLGYEPLPGDLSESLLLVFRQLGHNIMSFLVALVGLGLAVSFFALVAPKPPKERSS